MGTMDVHFEIHNKVSDLPNTIFDKVEAEILELAEGKDDIIGASVSLEELAKGETPHRYQARLLVYARPDNVVAVEKADGPEQALKGAVDAVVRQVRERREKLK